MSIVPPLLSSRWTRYAADTFAAGEQLALHVTRLGFPQQKVPIVVFHDYLRDAVGDLDNGYEGVMTAHTSTGYPVIEPLLVGTSQWATPDVVGTGGAVDQAIAYANAQVWIATRADKVAILAFGMGTLNALNWAWRNPGKVRSLVLVGPITNAAKFYTDNPGLQAAINADWGSGAAWTAALPTIDPLQNLALIRPFGHRIQLWYGTTDAQIAGADVEAFAELVGADANAFTGNETQRHLVPSGPPAVFTLRKIRERRTAYIGWDHTDLDRIQTRALNLNNVPANRNTNARQTIEAVGGRRFEFTRLSGSDGNERWAHLLTDFEAPDVAVKNIWYNGDGAVAAGVPGIMTGQHGNMMTVHYDEVAGTFLAYVVWVNILFNIPWTINRAVWSGVLGTETLTQLGAQNSIIPGLRLSAGGQVLASSRTAGIVTLVVHEEDLDAHYRSGIIDVDLAPSPLGDFIGTIGSPVRRVDANHLQYSQAGADVVSGGPGTWADFTTCFPYVAETEKQGLSVRGRFYKPDQSPPTWGDPDWSFTWQDTGNWGWPGYGKAGAMIGHTGINDPGKRASQQIGPLSIVEM